MIKEILDFLRNSTKDMIKFFTKEIKFFINLDRYDMNTIFLLALLLAIGVGLSYITLTRRD